MSLGFNDTDLQKTVKARVKIFDDKQGGVGNASYRSTSNPALSS